MVKTSRQQVNKEKEKLEKEIRDFEENIQKNIENQREKLMEIIRIEEEARQSVKQELEAYKKSLLNAREKNLKMKYNLSFLNHVHHLTKSYVFSYNVEWPLESFSK